MIRADYLSTNVIETVINFSHVLPRPLFSLKMPAFRKGSEFVIKHVENGNNVHNQRTYAVFPTCAMLKGSITVGLLMNGLLFSYKTLLNVPEGLRGWIFDLVSVLYKDKLLKLYSIWKQ